MYVRVSECVCIYISDTFVVDGDFVDNIALVEENLALIFFFFVGRRIHRSRFANGEFGKWKLKWREKGFCRGCTCQLNKLKENYSDLCNQYIFHLIF